MNVMLNKTTLIAALAVQVAIVGVLLAVRSGSAVEPDPFLDFDSAAVDALSISNAEGAVKLEKQEGAWRLSDGLPADGAKVDGVLEALGDASGSWPVATSASVQERFEVAEANHQRRLTLSAAGEIVADIYLGTSPSYRKAHARRVDDDDIYAIAFSNYEAGVKNADWVDKSLLRPAGALTGIAYNGVFALTKDDDGTWTAASGATLDQAKVETFAGRFTGLTVTGVSDQSAAERAAEPPDTADQTEAEIDDPPKTPQRMTFALTDDEGVQTLTVHRFEESDFVAESDRVSGTYTLSSYIAEQLHQALADLAPDASAPSTDAISNDVGVDGGDVGIVAAATEDAPADGENASDEGAAAERQ